MKTNSLIFSINYISNRTLCATRYCVVIDLNLLKVFETINFVWNKDSIYSFFFQIPWAFVFFLIRTLLDSKFWANILKISLIRKFKEDNSLKKSHEQKWKKTGRLSGWRVKNQGLPGIESLYASNLRGCLHSTLVSFSKSI